MPCDTHTTHSPPSPFSVIVARGISVLFPLVEVLTLLVSLMTFVCTDLWFSFAPGAICQNDWPLYAKRLAASPQR